MKTLAFAAFVALLGGLTLTTLLLGGGDIVLALAPVAVVAALYVAARLPLSVSLLLVTFLALTMENPSDVPAVGQWKSPLYPLGTLLLAHLNLTFVTHRWLAFSGLDVILVYLFAVALHRRLDHRRGSDRPSGARPMRIFAIVSLAGVAWMWTWGMARGEADVASSLWQVQRVVYLPLVYFLFEIALRGRSTWEALAEVIIAAACLKAILALYIRATVAPSPGATVLDYATTHADSMLFAGAFCLVVALGLDGLDRRRALLGALVLPLLLAGMIANHRRLVWVEVAAGLATVYWLSPPTRLKRTLTRAAVLASPIVVLYAGAGWSSTSGLFAPVQVIRSVVDSKADASTEWRDWENYDLFFTLRQSPIFGTGYGHGYVEAVKLPEISQAYALYRFIPHNSILGLWAYGGLVGFTALWSMLVVGLFLAARAARKATASTDRAAAISACAAIVIYLVHCYGDMGLGTWTSVFLVAPAFAVASHVALATGAWPSRSRRRPRTPEVVISLAPRPVSEQARPSSTEAWS
jgi:O-antigen ligase